MNTTDVSRDITYSGAARTRAGRAMIHALECATGKAALIRRAAGYEQDMARGRSFWQVIPERYGLSMDIISGEMRDIPTTGPLILIANHPYGILDGLMMGYLLDHIRGDFRILANSVFRRAEALTPVLLPISFDDTKDAVRLNLETRAKALRYLSGGGEIAPTGIHRLRKRRGRG